MTKGQEAGVGTDFIDCGKYDEMFVVYREKNSNFSTNRTREAVASM